MTVQEFAKVFDHTLLKAEATETAIRQLCQEALEWRFASVCVNPCWVALASQLLGKSGVKVCTVVGFPLGANAFELKAHETRLACGQGASEIDMVMNVGWALSGHWGAVRDDLQSVIEAAGTAHVKVILETCYLSDEQIVLACRAAIESGARFVKTSTGFGPAGATVRHVKLMRETVQTAMQIKASGGIRTLEDTRKLLEAGADRIGASASIAILKEFKGEAHARLSAGY